MAVQAFPKRDPENYPFNVKDFKLQTDSGSCRVFYLDGISLYNGYLKRYAAIYNIIDYNKELNAFVCEPEHSSSCFIMDLNGVDIPFKRESGVPGKLEKDEQSTVLKALFKTGMLISAMSRNMTTLLESESGKFHGFWLTCVVPFKGEIKDDTGIYEIEFYNEDRNVFQCKQVIDNKIVEN